MRKIKKTLSLFTVALFMSSSLSATKSSINTVPSFEQVNCWSIADAIANTISAANNYSDEINYSIFINVYNNCVEENPGG